jgi:hypothetical protein
MVRPSSFTSALTHMMQLREAKSLVVAICMAYVTAHASMFYFCHSKYSQCSENSLRGRSLLLVILYQFFRETAFDTRDTAEDVREGMKTLPVRLGKSNTLLLMVVLGTFLEAFICKGILATRSGIHVEAPLLMESIVRVGTLIGVYGIILQYPKGSHFAWGGMSLLGLVPVLWAQRSLR